MQKITVEVPRDTLAKAQQLSGQGISHIVRESLEQFVMRTAQLELLKLQGSYTPSLSSEEMRSWEED